MTRIAALAAVLLIARSAGAVCSGDFDGNGSVEINEIITSVNNALNGCQAVGPTPTVPSTDSCPIDFTDNNTADGTPDCYYSGRWNEECGDDQLEARWISDGEFVVAGFLGFPDDGLFYGAEVQSGTKGNLIGWFTKFDATDLVTSSGTMTLTDSGRTLTIMPCESPFAILGCDFVQYNGVLTEVIQGTAAARAATRLHVNPAVLERLRAARDARRAKRDLRRQ